MSLRHTEPPITRLNSDVNMKEAWRNSGITPQGAHPQLLPPGRVFGVEANGGENV